MRILITSGPTREYIDPVRFLTNASSGKMGLALAEAVLKQGGQPVIVSGPVQVVYPANTEVHQVETTQQMLQRCTALLPKCDGIIAAAAPCDFQPVSFSAQKLQKSADENGMMLAFQETPDILAALGQMKKPQQWSIGFALETADFQTAGKQHALQKLRKKNCSFIVLNAPNSISQDESTFHVFDAAGNLRLDFTGTKRSLAEKLLFLIEPNGIDNEQDSTAYEH
ncbi:MAG: phosphopantothenoylcysteine decarboxylase [Planctomycetaceae bacterium]|jgi:phosphopantothenoylcysteine decarboxylase/phosphopantothenate--cysteine ligase|nr:phosphopantothenoylcysteine decarboxylase [Planctomycetaceae bacterium]